MMEAGLRIRAFRHLIGLSQSQFGKLFDLGLTRVINVENNKAKANEKDYFNICSQFPEVAEWLTYGGNIELARLKVGKTEEHKHAMDLYEDEYLPRPLKHKIR